MFRYPLSDRAWPPHFMAINDSPLPRKLVYRPARRLSTEDVLGMVLTAADRILGNQNYVVLPKGKCVCGKDKTKRKTAVFGDRCSKKGHQIRRSRQRKTISATDNSSDTWTAKVTCPDFKPNALEVKVDGDSVHVHAKSEDRRDGCMSTYEMRRIIPLPDGIDRGNLTCSIEDEPGVLLLKAPKQNANNKRRNETEKDGFLEKRKKNDCEVMQSAMTSAAMETDENHSAAVADSSSSKPAPHPPLGEGHMSADAMDAETSRPPVTTSPTENIAEHRDISADGNCVGKDRQSAGGATEDGETDLLVEETSACLREGLNTDATSEGGQDEAGDTSLPEGQVQARGSADDVDSAAAGESCAQRDFEKDADSATLTDVQTPAGATESPVCGEEFSLSLDMQGYLPRDIRVTVVNNMLIIQAERRLEDTRCIGVERVQRRVVLPDNADPAKLTCVARDDGTVTISSR